MSPDSTALIERHVSIPVEHGVLRGDIHIPPACIGLVVFAHGSGSSRLSPRNQHVASILNNAHLATLLVDLLTPDEEAEDIRTARLRFDIQLLTSRVRGVLRWVDNDPRLEQMMIGLFGASTGAAAALGAAAQDPGMVRAVVSRGGRPDLAHHWLEQVSAPTLLIVGERDPDVLELNRAAALAIPCEHRLTIVPGATHLFEEPGALDHVAQLAAGWFVQHLAVQPERIADVTPVVSPEPPPAPRRVGLYGDRAAAGSVLAEAIAPLAHTLIDPIVIGLPRGGVEVAVPVARAMGTPVDIVVARKIGVPGQPELALGAIDEEGISIIDDDLRSMLGLSPRRVQQLTEAAHREAQSRAALLRDGRPIAPFGGRDVILVDDGYATGKTARVAARFLRRHGARHVILAVPVGPTTLITQRPVEFNQVICPLTPEPFHAVGLHYRHFDQVSDDAVRTLLHAHSRHYPTPVRSRQIRG